MKNIILFIKENLIYAMLTALVCILVLISLEIYISGNTAISYPIELWIEACSILDFFFPLIATLPFTWKLFYERKDGFIRYVGTRMSRSSYVLQKILSGMLSVFFMVVIIYYVGLVVAVLFIKPQTISDSDVLYRYVFGKMQVEMPLIFGILWCAWKGFIGGLIVGFGYGIAMVVDNIFVAVLMPFIYCVLENFVTACLHLELYSLCTTYILNRLSPYSMRPVCYMIGVISFLILGSLIIWLAKYRKKQVDCSEKYY